MSQVSMNDIQQLDNGNKLVGGIEFPPRKVWVKTYGCQMNYHDTERILDHLTPLNFTQTQDKTEADFMIFNTCAVRDLANQKFYSHLGESKHQKDPQKQKVKKKVLRHIL